ncbi:MAG: hypothetical protein ACT4QC_01395 [Planctomycetaceae bacterium]
MSERPERRRGPIGLLVAAWRADPARFLFGVPLLLLGGVTICSDVASYFWVQAGPHHRRAMYLSPIGIVPFLVGFWLVGAAIFRIVKMDEPHRLFWRFLLLVSIYRLAMSFAVLFTLSLILDWATLKPISKTQVATASALTIIAALTWQSRRRFAAKHLPNTDSCQRSCRLGR